MLTPPLSPLRMKRVVLLLVTLCWCTMMFAVRIDDRYVMKPTDGGQIYFILPYEIPTKHAGMKNLSVDVTHLTQKDSVTMNVSIWSDIELQVDSVVLVGGERLSISKFQTFFIEKDGKWWLHRYSIPLSWDNWNMLYNASEPFLFYVFDTQRTIQYAYSSKQWKAESEWMNQILHIINKNKQFYNPKR